MFEGVREVEIVGRSSTFYNAGSTTGLYAQINFGLPLNTITVVNDSGTDTINISFDGATLAGSLYPNEDISINVLNKSSIYIRGLSGGDGYRIWGY